MKTAQELRNIAGNYHAKKQVARAQEVSIYVDTQILPMLRKKAERGAYSYTITKLKDFYNFEIIHALEDRGFEAELDKQRNIRVKW